MKKAILLLVMLLPLIVTLAQVDSTYQGKAGVADVADSDPGLFIVMMCILIGFIGAIFMGLILIAFVCLFIGLLSLIGITSIATVAGIYGRSFRKGLSWFFRLGFTAAGLGSGFVAAVIIHYIWLQQYHFSYLALWSASGGALSGFLVGILVFKALEKLYARYFPAKQRVPATT